MTYDPLTEYRAVPPVKRKSPEALVQTAIVEYLRTVFPKGIVTHIPNGGKRSKATAAMLKRLGTLAGMPDILVALPNRTVVFFEVKAKASAHPSKGQREVLSTLKQQDQFVAVVYSIECVEHHLKQWGLV